MRLPGTFDQSLPIFEAEDKELPRKQYLKWGPPQPEKSLFCRSRARYRLKVQHRIYRALTLQEEWSRLLRRIYARAREARRQEARQADVIAKYNG